MWKKIDHGPSDDDDNDDEEQIVQHTADHIFFALLQFTCKWFHCTFVEWTNSWHIPAANMM